jgi:hypothetical protein
MICGPGRLMMGDDNGERGDGEIAQSSEWTSRPVALATVTFLGYDSSLKALAARGKVN